MGICHALLNISYIYTHIHNIHWEYIWFFIFFSSFIFIIVFCSRIDWAGLRLCVVYFIWLFSLCYIQNSIVVVVQLVYTQMFYWLKISVLLFTSNSIKIYIFSLVDLYVEKIIVHKHSKNGVFFRFNLAYSLLLHLFHSLFVLNFCLKFFVSF